MPIKYIWQAEFRILEVKYLFKYLIINMLECFISLFFYQKNMLGKDLRWRVNRPKTLIFS